MQPVNRQLSEKLFFIYFGQVIIHLPSSLFMGKKEGPDMRPVILMTAGLRDTDRGLTEQYLFFNYAKAIEAQGAIPVSTCADPGELLEELADRADGLCLTGGCDIAAELFGQARSQYSGKPDPWRDAQELYLCRLFLERKKPVLGICRGLQMINTALGGDLVQDLKDEKGLDHPYHSIHSVRSTEGSWFRETFGESFLVNSYHHQAIGRLGDGLRVTVTAEEGRIIEAVEHETLPVFAVQWHPERQTGEHPYDPEAADMTPVFRRFVDACRK